MSVDLVVLEWSTDLTRDQLVATQIISYLRFNKINCVEGPLQNGRQILDKFKPKILLLVNTVGAKTSIDIAKYANKKGIVVVSLYGEGNFSENRIEQFVWGHNKKNKEIIDDFRLVWSKKALELIEKYYPILKKTTFLGGCVGADNYVMNISRDLISPDIRTKYDCIVGVGCWNFCIANPQDHRYQDFSKAVGLSEIKRLQRDAELFNKELLKLIESTPKVLFLIKEHPHKANLYNASGVDGVNKYKNVVFVGKNENIINCIASSDIWLTYESTTAMEAWLLDKPTALLNPTGVEFETPWRSDVYKGQPNYENHLDWQKAINSYCQNNILPGFDDLQSQRQIILESVFGFNDGFNHVRVGNFLLSLIYDKELVFNLEKPNLNFKDILISKVKFVIWHLSRILNSKNLWPYMPRNLTRFKVREWDVDFLKKYIDEINSYQMDFYKRNNLSEAKLREIKYIT